MNILRSWRRAQKARRDRQLKSEPFFCDRCGAEIDSDEVQVRTYIGPPTFEAEFFAVTCFACGSSVTKEAA